MFGNVSVVSDTTDKSVEGAFAILSVLGHDNKFTQRLEELKGLVDAANKTLGEAKNEHDMAEQAHLDAKDTLTEAQRLRVEANDTFAAQVLAAQRVKENEINLSVRETDLAAGQKQLVADTAQAKNALDTLTAQRKAELDAREQGIKRDASDKATSLEAYSRNLDARDVSLKARETAVSFSESKSKEITNQLAQKQVDLDARLAKLRDIVG